ncbi:MAG: CMP deaminase [Planctomycetaceae bacterium]|nr:CMP deaminase [Planctomycetaceae bacterium]
MSEMEGPALRRKKWDERFLEMAELVAGWSRDPSTKCGCVIVRPDRTIAATGYNGFVRGCPVREDEVERDEKLSRVVHAETNALLAAKEPVEGYLAYVYPFLPCDRCAVNLIQAGIARVVTVTGLVDIAEDRWAAAFGKTKRYFEESGVSLTIYSWKTREIVYEVFR